MTSTASRKQALEEILQRSISKMQYLLATATYHRTNATAVSVQTAVLRTISPKASDRK